MEQVSENLRNAAHGYAPEIHHAQRERIEKRDRKEPADAAMGIAHGDMSLDAISHSLARLLKKGVRTASLYRVAGIPVVLVKTLPTGVIAMRSGNEITAYRDGKPIVTLPVWSAPSVLEIRS